MQALQTFDLPQFGKGQSEDHGIEGFRFRAAWRVEAGNDLSTLGVKLGQREALPHVGLVLERVDQRVDQRRRTALDTEHFVALAEHRKRLAHIGADEIHHEEARLILSEQTEFDIVGDIEQIDRPIVGLAAELLEVGLQAHVVELAGIGRPIVMLVGKLVSVGGDLLGNRQKSSGLLLRVDHVLRRMELPAEKINVLALAFGGEFLHLDAEVGTELLQIFMACIYELAAELAEHALVEVVDGEHASAPPIARLEYNRRRAGSLQTIGRGQSGNAAADDGDGTFRSLLLGVGAPVQHRRQRRSTSRSRGYPQQSAPCQRGRLRYDQTLLMERTGESSLYGSE